MIVGIDSSKTDTAIDVSDSNGNTICILEFWGSEDKDVLALCYQQRIILRQLFRDAKFLVVGIEDIITKKNEGINQHQSRFKITAVFFSFIMFFQDTFGISPELVNNMEWKAAILPEEYRKSTHDKGSYDWFRDTRQDYAFTNDNVTDAICIKRFLCKKHGVKNGIFVSGIEVPKRKYQSGLYTNTKLPRKSRLFRYNSTLTLKQNMDFIANYTDIDSFSHAIVPTDKLTIEEIYKNCFGTFNKKEDQLILIVKVV